MLCFFCNFVTLYLNRDIYIIFIGVCGDFEGYKVGYKWVTKLVLECNLAHARSRCIVFRCACLFCECVAKDLTSMNAKIIAKFFSDCGKSIADVHIRLFILLHLLFLPILSKLPPFQWLYANHFRLNHFFVQWHLVTWHKIYRHL